MDVGLGLDGWDRGYVTVAAIGRNERRRVTVHVELGRVQTQVKMSARRVHPSPVHGDGDGQIHLAAPVVSCFVAYAGARDLSRALRANATWEYLTPDASSSR